MTSKYNGVIVVEFQVALRCPFSQLKMLPSFRARLGFKDKCGIIVAYNIKVQNCFSGDSSGIMQEQSSGRWMDSIPRASNTIHAAERLKEPMSAFTQAHSKGGTTRTSLLLTLNIRSR